MSYNVYTTEGLILSYTPLREADRVYSILTRDLGLIRCTATGVRKETSKLRGSLEPLTLSNVSLIKGKEYWRLTSAVFKKNIARDLESKKKILQSVSKSLVLLAGLVQGEEAHSELYDSLIPIIESAKGIEVKDADVFEIVLVARILFHLGYLSLKDVPEGLIHTSPTNELFEEIKEGKHRILEVINQSLRTTDLA